MSPVSIRRALGFALSSIFLLGAITAQGELVKGFYTDSRLGFRVKIPGKWKQVPTQIDEKWIVAQFQSNQEYEGDVKLDGGYSVHRPLMRVIQFDEEAIREMAKVREETEDETRIRTLKLPYRDYRDYVRRNLAKGGFHFSKEETGKVRGIECEIYEVKVEKMARGGRRRFIAYVFKGEGINFAVEFEFLEAKYNKLKKYAMRSINSFKLLPRVKDASSQTADPTTKTFGRSWRINWKKKSAAERHKIRKDAEIARAKKAIAGLPQGWKVTKSKSFTVLSHASKKYTRRLVSASETCRKWLDKRFGALNDEYVSRGIIRVCRDATEYSAYRQGSADAFSIDDREIAAYEDKGAGNTGAFGNLFYSLYNQFMADKNDLLYNRTPIWLVVGLELYYMDGAYVKGSKIDFKVSEYEPQAFRNMRRRDQEPRSPQALMNATYDDFVADRRKSISDMSLTWELVTFFRFMESSSAQRLKLFKNRKDFLLEYLKATAKAAEDYEDREEAERSTKEAETEAEEEKQAKARDQRFNKRLVAITTAVNKVMCGWSADEWESLDKAYRAYLKKIKYL